MTGLGMRERDALLAAIHGATLAMKAATPEGAFEVSMERLGRLLHERRLEQRYAIEWDEISRFNRLFGLRHAVEAELKRREGDQRRALLPLLDHRDLQVRLNAATDTR